MVCDLKFFRLSFVYVFISYWGPLFIRTMGGGIPNNRESGQPKGKLRALGDIQKIITQC